MPEILGNAVPPGWEAAATIANPGGPNYRLLFYPNPTEVRFEHTCDRAHRDAGVIICAQLLTNVNQPGQPRLEEAPA
jgi:hypothetical protein